MTSNDQTTAEPPASLRIGVMVSGRGVALSMTLRACRSLPGIGSVVAVAANRECRALDVAREAEIPKVGLFDLHDYRSQFQRDLAISDFMKNAAVNFVFTAGYSETVDSVLLDSYPDRVMSIYPSLLPAYATEVDTLGAPLRDGVKLIGVSFHLRQALSGAGGPILAQRAISVDFDDTIQSLDPKIAEVEDEMLPGILLAFAERRVTVTDGRVRISPPVNVSE